MVLSVNGPKRPSRAFAELNIDQAKVRAYEKLFDKYFIGAIKLFFDPSNGYHIGGNKVIYDSLWGKIFQSLTGDTLEQCLTLSILSDKDYLQKVIGIFGSEERFRQFVGHYPMEVQGVNLDGTWVIQRDKKNLALLADTYHEIGHRVYPKSADRYNHELGANYFMFLALKKTNTELYPHGLPLPLSAVDFGKQLTVEHERALEKARQLVDTDTRYVHKSK